MADGTGASRGFDFGRMALVAAGSAFALLPVMGLMQVRDAQPPPIVPDGRVIDRVEFEGAVTTDAAYLQSIIRIKPGAVWDREQVADAVNRLAETGKFEDSPYAEPREEEGRLVLVFVIRERPFVTTVDVVGSKKFKPGELLKEIELTSGSPINPVLIRQARDQIVRKYKEAGYYYATVEVDEDVLRDERRVLLRVSEGPRVKVRDIRFEGNTAFAAGKLRTLIETQTYLWLFRTGSFDDETAARDAAAIKRFYVDRGYLNAQVGYRREMDGETNLALVFLIEEGLQHFIKSMTIEGNTVFGKDQIAASMKSGEMGPLDADVLEADRKRILDDYGTLGYIYARVSTTHVFDEQDGFVNLTVTVEEGSQYRVGQIVVRGNRYTQDRVVRRELGFYPEEFFNTTATREAEQRLVETRLFESATITPQGDAPDFRDALVDVEEAETTTILFGVGVTSNSGLVGSISVEQRNFDLFDWPRDAREFFRGRAFRGAGQILRLQFEPGTEVTRGSIEFREPYLFDKEIGFNVSAYAFERGRKEYDEQRLGGTTSIDKRFREGILKGWAGEVALRFEYIDIDDVPWFSAREIEKVEGGSFLTSVKGSLLRDRTDSRWLPSRGDRFKVSWEQAGALGGDYDFSKVIGEYDHYWTVHRDQFDRKHIVQVGAAAGQIFGDVPVFERFYAGGIGSIRGFEFRGISPRAGLRGDRVGGDFMLLTNAQYSFPLVGETVRGVTFLDMGTVEDDFGLTQWRASAGFGARIYIKYFGPIPLSFDFGFPIAKDDDDDTQVFSFSFGTTF